jgi:hypothetical protein
MIIGRRNFVAGLGLGAATPLLSPLCRRLVGEARGQANQHKHLFIFAASNGWNHESDCEGAPKVSNKPGENSLLFKAAVRAPNDFDLPAFMEPLRPHKGDTLVLYGLDNFEGSPEGFHGSGSCGLTAAPKGQGVSIDRVIGAALKQRHGDLYVGCNFASTISGRVACPSYDGPGKKADAYTTPVKAYEAYFGAAAGLTPAQTRSTLALDKSLFDGMTRDLERARGRLAGAERAKLDQVLESTREVEKKLAALQNDTRLAGKPPAPTVNATGLRREVIRAFVELAVQVQRFGLTHVSLVSLGAEAATYSDSWGSILPGIPPDSHNGLMHTRNYEQIRRIATYQAGEVAHLRSLLVAAGGSLADDSVCLWTNTSGLRHHRGSNCQVLVLLAGRSVGLRRPLWLDTSRLVTGKLYRTEGARHLGEAYVSVAQAMGVPLSKFGGGNGPLPGLGA